WSWQHARNIGLIRPAKTVGLVRFNRRGRLSWFSRLNHFNIAMIVATALYVVAVAIWIVRMCLTFGVEGGQNDIWLDYYRQLDSNDANGRLVRIIILVDATAAFLFQGQLFIFLLLTIL
ncbi:hypothetical protein HK102_005694, partial [Quaeritorhiza haematococci]